jgi:Family of unknown function (DUF6384)
MPDKTATPDADLSIAEMLRIMDVARSLRREREVVEGQLNLDQTKQELRQRLMGMAGATGEPVTPEEVEVAIQLYYDNLHAYQEPPRGFALMLANLYIHRGRGLFWAILLAAAGLLIWWLL